MNPNVNKTSQWHQINSSFNWSQALNPIEFLKQIAGRKDLFKQLIKKNIASKFRHSYLGVLWLFLPPLCILSLYIYVFSFIFQLRWPERELSSPWSFGLAVYLGITIFAIFTDSVMTCTTAIANKTSYIKRIFFPLELLPASIVGANFLLNVLIILLIYVLHLSSGGDFNFTALIFFPVIIVPLLLLVTGCCWLVSALGIFFRDLNNLLGIVVMVLFFTSPIFYSEAIIPEHLRFIMYLNPMSPFVINIRNVYLFNYPVDWALVGLGWLWGIVLYQLGYFLFSYLRRQFADVL